MSCKSRWNSDMSAAAVLGAGAWGTTLSALQAANFRRVYLYTPEADSAEEVTRFHSNSRYLDDTVLPANVFATTSLERALEEASAVVVAVPSHASRQVAGKALALLGPKTLIVLATKGLEQGTGLLSIEVWRHEIASAASPGRRRHPDPLVLSGPNLAREISRGMPAVSSIAGTDAVDVGNAARALEHPLLSLVPSGDPLGAQAAGALKNVYAVGCGMASALKWGDNAMAALVWRGLEETARFAQAIGGDPCVIATPAGVGDFLATCTSPLSRNHDLGRMISGACDGNDEVRGVREGAQTATEALRRGRSLGVDMPLLEAVSSVMAGIHKPDAVLEAACGAPRRAPSLPSPDARAQTSPFRHLGPARTGMGVAVE
ncbi:MAG: NAD(P)H-dependent glycerol-3-phosphate dehydrogenase [Candidatus Geothermincolia bacterium]